jgi:hypothetical protein
MGRGDAKGECEKDGEREGTTVASRETSQRKMSMCIP